MDGSRRSFIQLVGLGGLTAASGRPLFAAAQQRDTSRIATDIPGGIRLSANENANGPGQTVMDAVQGAFGRMNRYPFQGVGHLQDALAAKLGVEAKQLTIGCGSSEILDASVLAFTTPDRGVVTALPTFELIGDLARHLSHPVVEVPVTGSLELDLAQMADKAAGAGLIYICNPNNPTGSLHGAKAIEDFIAAALKREPNVTILIDEAYHEYVERDDYKSAIPIAIVNPRVVVSRTFSKIYGLAGMRCGYAVGHPDTIRQLSKWLDPLRISCLTTVAALTALGDPARVPTQCRMNHENRTFTEGVFRDAGFAPVPSQANFVMVNVKRDIRQFQAACRERGVEIARPFPPLLTYARVTIGTMDEMKRAAPAFREALAAVPNSAHALPALELRGYPRLASWEC